MSAITPGARTQGPARTTTAAAYFQVLVDELDAAVPDQGTSFDVSRNVLTVTGAAAYNQLVSRGVIRPGVVAEINRVGRPDGLPYLVAKATSPSTLRLTLSATHTQGAI